MSLEDFKSNFLERTLTTDIQREDADMSWPDLHAIAQHHAKNRQFLENRAVFEANNLRLVDGIRSVSWRVKDEYSLIEKIIRKRSENKTKKKPNKYSKITLENYQDVVTDLIGVRGLHLFRADFRKIHTKILETCSLEENPTIYVREGDLSSDDHHAAIKELKIQIQPHPKGYRSLHYIIRSGTKGKGGNLVEYQIRTLYDEAWSEIDHNIRYPNLTEDKSIGALLLMLNRITGNADELATFIQALASPEVIVAQPDNPAPNDGDDLIEDPPPDAPKNGGGGLLNTRYSEPSSSTAARVAANLGLGYSIGSLDYTDLIGQQARAMLDDRKRLENELEKLKSFESRFTESSALDDFLKQYEGIEKLRLPSQNVVDRLEIERKRFEREQQQLLRGIDGDGKLN